MNWKKNLVLYVLVGISLILSTVSICLNISHIVVENETLILGFVGILVTIVVIGNVAHVIVIQDNTDKKIKQIEEQNKTTIKSLIEVSESVSNLVEQNKIIYNHE